MQGARHGVDEEGLGQTRNAFEEEVTAGEQCDQHSFHDDLLPDHDFGNAFADGVEIGGRSFRGWVG